MEELRRFADTGWCIYRGALQPAALQPLRALLEQHVDARVAELVEEGVAPHAHASAPLETRWAMVVDDAVRAGPAGWRDDPPEWAAQGNWGAPTGRHNARGTGGPHLLLHKAIHELYTSPELVAIASALLPSSASLKAHGDYWFRPHITGGLNSSATTYPLHQDAFN